jgi:hypothetical protein
LPTVKLLPRMIRSPRMTVARAPWPSTVTLVPEMMPPEYAPLSRRIVRLFPPPGGGRPCCPGASWPYPMDRTGSP